MESRIVGRRPVKKGTGPALEVRNEVKAALAVVVAICISTVKTVVATGTFKQAAECRWSR